MTVGSASNPQPLLAAINITFIQRELLANAHWEVGMISTDRHCRRGKADKDPRTSHLRQVALHGITARQAQRRKEKRQNVSWWAGRVP